MKKYFSLLILLLVLFLVGCNATNDKNCVEDEGIIPSEEYKIPSSKSESYDGYDYGGRTGEKEYYSDLSNDNIYRKIDLYFESRDSSWINKIILTFLKERDEWLSDCDPNYISIASPEILVYDFLFDLAKHYEDGAKKYSDRNWEKGIPAHCFIDSGLRHYNKWMLRWDDEPHDRAFVWNMLGLL